MLNIPAPLLVDFYKWGHVGMIPKGTRVIYSNVTPRGAKYFQGLPDYDGKVLIVGLRRAVNFIFSLWQTEFFDRPKDVVMCEIELELRMALPSNARIEESLEHFAKLHDLGYLPVRISCVPEGTRIPLRVPFMTIRNTHDDFAFLTNFLETIISAETWKTIVNASTAFEFLTHLTRDARDTVGGDFVTLAGEVTWQAHDFSMRGMSGITDACDSGIGHLSCFKGTDTFGAIRTVRNNYSVPQWFKIGGSVVATEHMIMCLGGQVTEIETIRKLIEDEYPTGVISVVSDTWDFFKVLTEYLPALKTVILNRKPDSSGLARVVIRPDSGDPVKILCGDPDAPVGSPEYKGAVECLWDVFGGTITEAGYKLLDTHIRLIYGDSIFLKRSVEINQRLKEKGFCSFNVVRGIGSFTYQLVTRDNFSIAVKATAAIVDGEMRSLLKNPKTDDGTKKSATGFLKVMETLDTNSPVPTITLVENLTMEEAEDPTDVSNLLQPMVIDGEFAPIPSWLHVCRRVDKALGDRLYLSGRAAV